MSAIAINHVTLPVSEIEESIEFYETALGLERTPSLKTDSPSAWFRVGNGQLHLTERDVPAPAVHHFALTVSEFEPVYDELDQRDAFDSDVFGSALFLLPDDAIQLYFRDPSGNLLEADSPNALELPSRITERASRRQGPPAGYEPTIPGGPSLFLE